MLARSPSYSVGLVNNGTQGTDVGGLVGTSDIHVISSYWAPDSSDQTTSAGGSAKSLVEMMQVSTFIGWGCDGAWTINENNETPRLLWKNAPPPSVPATNLLTYAGGSGDPNDPYQIADTNNLKDLSRTPCDWDKHFILTADLDMSGVAISQIDISTTAVFSGLFDGGGHTIDNLTINLPTTDNVGLFGAVNGIGDPNGIMDLGPINSNLTGGRIVGGLLGSVGSNPPDSTVNNSFWDIQTSGQTSSAGGTGKTTAPMQDPNTFILAGWDFVGENVNGTEEFWRICEDKNYPKLDWQVPIVGDFVCPDGVEVFDFGYISGYWMAQNCQTNNNCAGTDLDLSGDMGLGDLFLWLPNWLEDQ